MRLRYAGTCRICSTALPAGTTAHYERSRRTVRCLGCRDTAAEPAPRHAEPSVAEQPTPTPAPTPQSRDALRLRAPASAVISETLRAQASRPPRSRVARFFGANPLGADALPWYRGAIGEIEVAQALDRLGPGWTAVHAIPVGSRGSDIDHLVIGPGGVFTINSKNHSGKRVWVGGRRLLVDGQRKDHLRNALFEARRVGRILTQAAAVPVDVTPVVAIVGAGTITVKETPAEVVVVSAGNLVRWLNRRPVTLTETEVARISSLSFDPATWGDPVLPDADLAGFAALREEVDVARRRRVGWALVGMLGLLLAVPLVFWLLQAAVSMLLV